MTQEEAQGEALCKGEHTPACIEESTTCEPPAITRVRPAEQGCLKRPVSRKVGRQESVEDLDREKLKAKVVVKRQDWAERRESLHKQDTMQDLEGSMCSLVTDDKEWTILRPSARPQSSESGLLDKSSNGSLKDVLYKKLNPRVCESIAETVSGGDCASLLSERSSPCQPDRQLSRTMKECSKPDRLDFKAPNIEFARKRQSFDEREDSLCRISSGIHESLHFNTTRSKSLQLDTALALEHMKGAMCNIHSSSGMNPETLAPKLFSGRGESAVEKLQMISSSENPIRKTSSEYKLEARLVSSLKPLEGTLDIGLLSGPRVSKTDTCLSKMADNHDTAAMAGDLCRKQLIQQKTTGAFTPKDNVNLNGKITSKEEPISKDCNEEFYDRSKCNDGLKLQHTPKVESVDINVKSESRLKTAQELRAARHGTHFSCGKTPSIREVSNEDQEEDVESPEEVLAQQVEKIQPIPTKTQELDKSPVSTVVISQLSCSQQTPTATDKNPSGTTPPSNSHSSLFTEKDKPDNSNKTAKVVGQSHQTQDITSNAFGTSSPTLAVTKDHVDKKDKVTSAKDSLGTIAKTLQKTDKNVKTFPITTSSEQANSKTNVNDIASTPQSVSSAASVTKSAETSEIPLIKSPFSPKPALQRKATPSSIAAPLNALPATDSQPKAIANTKPQLSGLTEVKTTVIQDTQSEQTCAKVSRSDGSANGQTSNSVQFFKQTSDKTQNATNKSNPTVKDLKPIATSGDKPVGCRDKQTTKKDPKCHASEKIGSATEVSKSCEKQEVLVKNQVCATITPKQDTGASSPKTKSCDITTGDTVHVKSPLKADEKQKFKKALDVDSTKANKQVMDTTKTETGPVQTAIKQQELSGTASSKQTPLSSKNKPRVDSPLVTQSTGKAVEDKGKQENKSQLQPIVKDGTVKQKEQRESVLSTPKAQKETHTGSQGPPVLPVPAVKIFVSSGIPAGKGTGEPPGSSSKEQMKPRIDVQRSEPLKVSSASDAVGTTTTTISSPDSKHASNESKVTDKSVSSSRKEQVEKKKKEPLQETSSKATHKDSTKGSTLAKDITTSEKDSVRPKQTKDSPRGSKK